MALINLVKWQYFLNISRYRPSPVHNEQNETFLFVRAPVLSQPMLLTADINKNKTKQNCLLRRETSSQRKLLQQWVHFLTSVTENLYQMRPQGFDTTNEETKMKLNHNKVRENI